MLDEVDRSPDPTTIRKLLDFRKKCIAQKQKVISEEDKKHLTDLIASWTKKLDLLLQSYEDRDTIFADYLEEIHEISLAVEFADRESELLRLEAPIDNPGASRYIQVHAPSGLGKTYLLIKASSEYEAAGWLCARLDFSSDERLRHNAMHLLEQLSEQFGGRGERVRTSADLAQQVVRARRQSVIFLDAVDLASGEVRRWIKMDLIPNLEDRIPANLRPYFIAAGRRPIREWAVYSRQRFESVPLTPFTDAVVDDLLRRFAREAGYGLKDDFFQSMTEAILSITKGHPACIKRVLQEIRSREFTMTAQEVVQKDTFNRTVGALLDYEILALQVSEKLREVFKTLCVLRGYTPSLLVRLAEDGWIPAREHIDWNLERELQATHLVEIPDSNPLYRIEPPIRQLVALQMAYNDKDKFLALNRAALSIFEEQVRGRDKDGHELPNRPQDRMQVALAVEALYHQATLLEQEGASPRRAKNRLQGKVKEYLSHRSTRESESYWADLLVGLTEKDVELTALIYELTGEGGLQFVLQPLHEFAGSQEV
ncbi:MAG: ATP-binding protein [Anaerolineae bacterium]